MVAWIARYISPQYPNGREFVLIGNDLDFETGTFGVAEDKLFFYASEYARISGVARVYIAANSGAKFGLASGVIDFVKASWTDENDHSKGFEYLYLEQSDREKIEPGVVITEPIKRSDGQVVHKIMAVIGSEKEGLGVENLQGSGLIAGATARAYEEIFTLTYVTGRAVGIGAYLVRLGQRTIQRVDAPIILTGCNALNSILGRDVYLSNLQIGGPQIMAANGVSHRTVTNDSDGVREILHWLSYIPVNGGNALDLIIPAEMLDDPIDRKVGIDLESFQADPRALLTGSNGNKGILDFGSWTEYLEAWAKSVIIGRGRLGGIPVGVICTESRSVESNVPSDPGKMEGVRPAPIRQAGQVWYPDSAWKTAQALRDFRLEGLPILILANWRGFSGGPGDLYDGILQFGSMIVEELSRATTPVFVYLPIGGELRGGSWVVLDSSINQNGKIEMYADPTARAGVMEPEGIVSIKFRNKEISRLMTRLEGKDLSKSDPSLEESLGCVYRQIAVKFADLHDSTLRMCAKGVIRRTVELSESRHFFYNRLCRRLMEEIFASKLGNCNETLIFLSELFSQKRPDSVSYSLVEDASIVNFLKENESEIEQKLVDKYKQKRIMELQSELKSFMN